MVTEPQVDPETGQEKLVKRYEHKIVREKLYIIPNSARKAEELSDLAWSAVQLYRQTGILLSRNDTVVEVCVENWNKFGNFQEALDIPFNETILESTKEGRNFGIFAKFWPLRVFKDHKEGDIITLEVPEHHTTYQLQLEQLSSRYGKLSGTVIDENGGLGIFTYKDPFTFERMLDFVTSE